MNESICTSDTDFKFVLSRIFTALPGAAPDVQTCGSTRLPTETTVVNSKEGCYASVSVGLATTKLDAGAVQQGVVLGKLKGMLECLPS